MDKSTARSTHYWFDCPHIMFGMNEKDTRSTVIANINMLMQAAGDSQHALAKKLGWRQSTLANLLSGRHNIAIERAAAIANVYGLEGWHLLMKDLPRDIRESKTISRLFKSYMASSAEGREHIGQVADREAAYNK